MLSLAANAGVSAQVQSQVQMARREADRAQNQARALEQRADQAQRSADREQARADGLLHEASAAGQRSDSARSKVSSLESGLQQSHFEKTTARNLGRVVDAFA